MALPPNIADREHQKFIEDADGKPALRIGPNAIQNEAGYTLDIDQFGRALSSDPDTKNQLKSIHEVLKDIRFQLQLITGAEIHE